LKAPQLRENIINNIIGTPESINITSINNLIIENYIQDKSSSIRIFARNDESFDICFDSSTTVLSRDMKLRK
jgi:hypothetical protein